MEPILCFITIHCNLIFVGIDTFYYLSPFVSSKSSKSDSNWKYFSFLQQPSLLQGQSLNVHTKFLQLLSTWKSWHWRESGMCDWFKICRAFCRAFFMQSVFPYYWEDALHKILVQDSHCLPEEE